MRFSSSTKNATYEPVDLREGRSLAEVVVILGVAGLLLALMFPFLLDAREAARKSSCQNNLRLLTAALRNYHDFHECLPPAASWNTNATASLALHRSKQIHQITNQGWISLLLPQLNESSLYESFDAATPIGHENNKSARESRLEAVLCPSDNHNGAENMHRFETGRAEAVEFARGNYAINGGSNNQQFSPPSTAHARGDFPHLVMDSDSRRYQMWGNGIAGINKCFRLGDFRNGQSTLVALEEIRAGIHPLDSRGSWALGQIGASITWSHGVNGDAFRPNNPSPISDDILGCGTLHEVVGAETLNKEGMPCVHYVDVNQQATARSKHEGGAHVSFLDGSVRFISDSVDPGLWHVMHSRETPMDVLADNFEDHLASDSFTVAHQDAGSSNVTISSKSSSESGFSNSLGMKFAIIPAGKFRMGMPDINNQREPPAEVPEHTVSLTHAFALGVHEVTIEQFRRAVELNGELQEPESSAALVGRSDFPVTNVTWNEAEAFCRALSALPEERSEGRRYRLPTEAEWEYACRSGKSEPFHWQRHRDNDDKSGHAVGSFPELPLTTVGSYPPNEFGLHDMRGNAWEWTADWYDRDYYERSPLENPQGPPMGYIKVVRGADWRFTGEPCRHDYPMQPPWKANPVVGFRIVCDLIDLPSDAN